jgi:hypothetical protein
MYTCVICGKQNEEAPAMCWTCKADRKVPFSVRPAAPNKTHGNSKHYIVRGWAFGSRNDVVMCRSRHEAIMFGRDNWSERGVYIPPERFFVVFSGTPIDTRLP